MNILRTEKLTKKYRRVTALDGLDLEIQEGMVFGLLGPNGSGKTTTLGLLLDVLKPTSGTYSWFDQAPSAKIRRQIGAILETPCFYPYLTAVGNLQIVATIKECSYSRIDEVLTLVGLFERRNDPFKTYSLGMKQRLAIASALLSDPRVLILDEPTNGLDPMGIFEIRQLIKQIAQTGKSIILASHLLDEVQKVCTHFMVLQSGKKLFQGSVQEALGNQRTIEASAKDMENLRQKLSLLPGVKSLSIQEQRAVIVPENGLTAEDVNQYLFRENIVVNHLQTCGGSLEQEFLKILSDHD